MKTYAAIYGENEVRRKSSSGGIFSLLASKYDVVYGVAMTKDCRGAEMIRTEGDISPLRGSKYFQARVGDAFRQTKQDLEDGRKVLFSGTGCQINGLKMFLKKDYPNLLTVDVVCHGAPSPDLWKAYADYLEGRIGKRLYSVNFRCKDHGWANFGMKENQYYESKDTNPFMQMFLRDYCLRPACYQCRAKELKLSDITIADFWGIEDAAPEMNDGMGTSLVITRTEKGQKILDSLKPQLKWKEVPYGDGVRCNPAEFRSPARPKERDTFFADLRAYSFPQLAEKYVPTVQVSLYVRLKRKAKDMIKKCVHRGETRMVSNADYGLLFTFSDNVRGE